MRKTEERMMNRKYLITNVMLELGMPAHLRGYHYLREAISLSMDNMELVGSVTKLLYPEIAKIYHTSNEKVERAIRSVIEVGWERGDIELYEEVFGYSVADGKKRPTNSEFVLGIADYAMRKQKMSYVESEINCQKGCEK